MFNVKNKGLTDKIMNKRKCKRSSCRVYSSNLRRINKEFSTKPFNIDLGWLKTDANSILKKIQKLGNVNQQRNFVSAGLIGFDLLNEDEKKHNWNVYLKTLNQKKLRCRGLGK